MRHVVILSTGGTIAGAADQRSGVGYSAGQMPVEHVLASLPELERTTRISIEPIAAVGSQDMSESIWFELARRAEGLLKREDVDGIVITHGTDTLEETALFLDLVLPRARPVVLVGAMRPATALSADGPLNLLEAIRVAGAPLSAGRGVLVVLNDIIHGAADATKTSTTAIEAFASPNRGPLGRVTWAGVHFFHPPVAAPAPYALPPQPPLPAVRIIYGHACMDDLDIRAALTHGVRGIVLAGMGGGNACAAAVSALAGAAAHGVAVVRASRVGSGAVLRNVEVNDDALGFVASGFLTPAKARVLLQILLANGVRDAAALQAGFDRIG